MIDLKNKKVLVSGATSGLGLEIAKLFLAEGATVMGISKGDQVPQELQSNENFSYISCDLSNPKDIEALEAEINKVEILINNAGIIQYDLLENHSVSRIFEVINTNLAGLISLTKVCLPSMKKGNFGKIVNISSTSGLYARANETVYVASKWGVRGFTESLRKEVEEIGVDVFGIYPGAMKTDLFNNAGGKTPENPETFMEPVVVAQEILDTIKKSDKMKVTHIEINRPKNNS